MVNSRPGSLVPKQSVKSTAAGELSVFGEPFGVSNPVTVRQLKRLSSQVRFISFVLSLLLAGILGLQAVNYFKLSHGESEPSDDSR